MKQAQLIRVFHRWSGLFLIVFLGLKILSGYTMGGHNAPISAEAAYKIHFSPWVDIPLLFLAVFHASYGILKIMLAGKIKNKDRTFVMTNVLAFLVLFVAILFIYII